MSAAPVTLKNFQLIIAISFGDTLGITDQLNLFISGSQESASPFSD
jgi:hypothetical protein